MSRHYVMSCRFCKAPGHRRLALCRSVAKAVSVLAPRLTHLDLSASRLLSLPAVGDLLSEKRALRSFADSATWAPAVHSSVYPAGGEPEQPEQSEEEEDEDAMGLRHLTFEPRCSVEYWGDVDAMRAVCCRLARLIRRHHGTLRRVEVNAPGREVYSALAECSSLEVSGDRNMTTARCGQVPPG